MIKNKINRNILYFIFLISIPILIAGCGCGGGGGGSSGGGDSSTIGSGGEGSGNIFEKYNVDVVFNGDYHTYVRTFPIKDGEVSTDLTNLGQRVLTDLKSNEDSIIDILKNMNLQDDGIAAISPNYRPTLASVSSHIGGKDVLDYAEYYSALKGVEGTTYIVTGGGGAPLHKDAGDSNFIMVSIANNHYVVGYSLDKDRILFVVKDTQGNPIDSFVIYRQEPGGDVGEPKEGGEVSTTIEGGEVTSGIEDIQNGLSFNELNGRKITFTDEKEGSGSYPILSVWESRDPEKGTLATFDITKGSGEATKVTKYYAIIVKYDKGEARHGSGNAWLPIYIPVEQTGVTESSPKGSLMDKKCVQIGDRPDPEEKTVECRTKYDTIKFE